MSEAEQLLLKLTEQFGLQQQRLENDTQLVSNCLQSLKNKVTAWNKEMQLHSQSGFENLVSAEERNVNCKNNNNTVISKVNKFLQSKDTINLSEQNIEKDHTKLPFMNFDYTVYINDSQDSASLQKQVKDLVSHIESQHELIDTLLRANQNYKDDYQAKLKSLSMRMRTAAKNRDVIQGMKQGYDKTDSKYDQLLRRISDLNSQLLEKKREIQTLKHVVNHNRHSTDHRLKKLQDELVEFKGNSELTESFHSEKPSFCEDDWKELKDLQANLPVLEQENANLRHLLSLVVSQRLQSLNSDNQQNRRHSLPGRVENEMSLADHIHPMRRHQVVSLI